MRRIAILDTTLRDGEQAPGCSMNIHEKLELAAQLARLGADIVEAGFAASSPGDFAAVRRIAETLRETQICALARATEKDIDAAAEALRPAVAPRINVFLATSPIHMTHKLRMTPQQVLERAAAATRYARNLCADVEFSAEDATRSDPEFLVRVLDAAIQAGARTVNIPDTVGYAMPEELCALVKYLREKIPNSDKATFSVHCHNDLGQATANSLAAITGGAAQVECTVNGIGERAGNAALEEIVMALHTRRDYFDCETAVCTQEISHTSRLVYSIIGQSPPLNKAIVGENTFIHESGIHQHGLLAERTTYEIFTPESIGRRVSAMVLGKHSGRHAFEKRLGELGYHLSKKELDDAFTRFKEIGDRKKEITDADLDAIAGHKTYTEDTCALKAFTVHSGKGNRAMCVLTLALGAAQQEDVSLGDGPIDAAYNAVDKVLAALVATPMPPYNLESYAIRSATDGKDALGEVVVKLRQGDRVITGRGVSTDVIEASILAYLNAINKLIP